MSATTDYQDYWINPRIKIAALWTSMLFIFVYVDLFSLYRADVRADIEAGKMFAFTIGQGFLLGVTIYIVVPSLMLFLSLVLPVRVTRMANIVAGGPLRRHDRGGRHRRVELLHPRKPHRGRSAGRRRLLRMDLAEGDRRCHRPVRPVPGRHPRALLAEGARVAPEPRFGASGNPGSNRSPSARR